MKVSNKGLLEILSHEAIVLNRYKDSVGVWTIGVGLTKRSGVINPDTFVGTLTIKHAIDLFREALEKYEDGVNKAFTKELTQNQFDAAVSFHFNTGRIASAGWVKHVNRGDLMTAFFSGKSGIMAWRKPPEIIKRRLKERDLFFYGRYSNKGKVNVYMADKNGNVLWRQGKTISLNF